MQRVALLLGFFIALCHPLIAQEAPATGRISVTARYLPNAGNAISATIPEAIMGDAVVPLQITQDATWLVAVNPVAASEQVTVSISDTVMMRTPAGVTATTPVPIFRGVIPLVFERPVIVLQTGTYRIELQIRRL
ncbi:hypothetical protein ACXR0O_17755 [Verrucomicrobiota bacterium sgz303538]